MVSESQISQEFGKDIVCVECGVPKPPKKFNDDSVVCKSCTPKVMKRQEVTISADEHARNDFTSQLVEMRKTADPQIVTGVQKALEILGQSPQEVMAEVILEMRNPSKDRNDLSMEQLAAMPVDFKTIGHYLKMLQEAQKIHDEDLKGANPFGNATPEDLRATMLQGAIEHSADDISLRKQLIHGFLERCPTFIAEVLEVAEQIKKEMTVHASA